MSHEMRMPKAGRDYPTKWTEFLDRFHSEEGCREYLERLRWPAGFVCPKCGEASQFVRMSRDRFICRACRQQTTVTAGTIFDKTRTELRVWFTAIWQVTSRKYGANALGLQHVLGLGSYETAWAMLHRLRRAMVRPDRDLLHGVVEVDETYLALTDKQPSVSAKKNRSNTTKIVIAVAVEIVEPKGFGRIRIQRITNNDAKNLLPFIGKHIEPGATLHTDSAHYYTQAAKAGYEHQRTVHLGSATPAHESMPGVHRVASLVQRWILGIHHGAIQPGQLDYYLDEFVFRFNRRTSRSRGLLFYRLLQQAVATSPITYNDIIQKTAT